MGADRLSRWRAFWAFLLYLGFVVYGSLLPFRYRDLGLEQALARFAEIAYLDLGVGSRADWVANIVLYVPLAFLACAWIGGLRLPGVLRVGATAVLAFALSLAIAVAVEFTQLFFAPRTVSLNDLLAEGLGALGGIALWAFGRVRVVRLLDAFAEGGRESLTAAIAAYALVYLALSLFPYDLLISASELAWKLESGNQGWLVAGSCGAWLPCGARLMGDAIGIAPLGVLLGLLVPRASHWRVFLAGLLIGLILEGLQLLLASGVSQGLSALMRGLGLVAGVAVGHELMRVGPIPLARLVWRIAPFAVLPYALLVAALHGWLSAAWLPLGDALGRLARVEFLPFYYHYFSTEPAAMASLLANAAMYAPVGVVVWAQGAVRLRGRVVGAGAAALLAVGFAAIIELGKLFVPPKQPDPTNLLIAAAAAAFAYAMARWLGQLLAAWQAPRFAAPLESAVERTREPLAARAAPEPVIDWPSPHPLGVAVAAVAGLAALVGVASYPVGVPFLLLGLLAYGALLWRWPLIWLFAVPALLPVLDLSPVTGRLLLDEFDLVVLVTLGLTYLRCYRLAPAPWPNAFLRLAFVLLWLTWVLATLRGLWPLLSSPGGLAPSSHSPLEAWMVGKGLLWALLLVPVLRRVPQAAVATAQTYVLNGLVAGLAMLSLAVLWERHVFVGLLDFDDVFRVTGTFASMHTGGAYIEAFIAFAFPALVVWTLLRRSWGLRLLGVALAALATYAMLVTYSRGGYAGLLIGSLVVAFGAVRWRGGSPRLALGLLAGLAAVAAAIAVPILTTGFAQQRLAQTAADFQTRIGHWQRALDLMDPGPIPALFGMGFGQYSSLYLIASAGERPPGTYALMTEDGNPYLRLGAGETVFLDQLVGVQPGASYMLSVRLRMPYGTGSLRVPLCEKALLYSFACVWERIELEEPTRDWVEVTREIDTSRLGQSGRWPSPPIKLSLHNGGGGPIDVDWVSLKAPDGRELIANGGFGDGVKRWLMVSDERSGWHIDQQWVETYVAHGLLGVLALVAVLSGAGGVFWPARRQCDLWRLAVAVGVVGVLTVGLLGSVADTSDLLLLVSLGAYLSGLQVLRGHRASARETGARSAQ